MNLFMDNEFLIFAGPGRLQPALNSGPDPDGAGRDWSRIYTYRIPEVLPDR